MTEEEAMRRELIDAAKNWLAIDGLWFLEIEKRYGMDIALEVDAAVWKQFSRIEADRIMVRIGLEEGGGLDNLEKALHHRLFSLLNTYEIKRPEENVLECYMITCRTQTARERKGLPLFPCKQIGIIDYETFAGRIDQRIKTTCISCPPDPSSGLFHCGFRFIIE